MKDTVFLMLSGLVAAGAAAALTLFVMNADTSASAASDAAAPDAASFETELEALERKQEELDRFLTTLSLDTAGTRNGGDQERAVAAAVNAWLDENASALLNTGAEGASAVAQDQDPALAAMRAASVSDLIDLITDAALSGEGRQLAWQRLAESGRLDEVVSELERLVELDPQDPDLRVLLGSAYLQQLFQGGSGPMAGVFAGKADAAFDAALQLDDSHWEARFTKAVSLSNWPAFLGKQGEAIAEFETLVAQQEQQTAEASHAQTYLFLGNMYLETGEAAKALDTWRRGLERFPTSDALRDQIEMNGGGGR